MVESPQEQVEMNTFLLVYLFISESKRCFL